MATARAFGLALPVTPLVKQMLADLIEKGQGEFDRSALLEIVEEISG